MRCAVCNSENPDNVVSCRSCGSPLHAVPAPASHTLPVGMKLQDGMFSLGKVLGQGGFGITYLGSDQRLARSVAIKEFFPVAQGCARQGTTVIPGGSISTAEFQEERKKFLEEAQRLAQFQHPSIVKVYSMFEENNTAYMVMEFLKGRTLLKMIEENGSLPEQDAVGYITKVGEALTVVHQANLLHRDIKPENVMVTPDGRAVLIDFGTAREFAAGKTRRMTTMLTPGYAPLEQYGQHARFGVFTDVYALGATLYHLLTGDVPIQAPDRASGVELPAPVRINPKISRVVSNAVLWAMEMRVDKRPQSVRNFLDALRGAKPTTTNGPDESSTNPPTTPNPHEPRIQQLLRELASPTAGSPPTSCDGRIQQINQRLAQLARSMPGSLTDCPACLHPTLNRIQGQRSSQCPICRSAQLRSKQIDQEKCPVCRSGHMSDHHIEHKAMFCPICRARTLQQDRRKKFGLAVDLWWVCPGCHAEFDVILGGRAKLVTVRDDPTGIGRTYQGLTLPISEWQKLTILSNVLWSCDSCNAHLYEIEDGRLTLVSYDSDPLGVGDQLIGKTYYKTIWVKLANGMSPGVGNTHCPGCGSDFDYDSSKKTMNLLNCDPGRFPLAAQLRGRFLPMETWSLVGAGKNSLNPGWLCSSCRTEFDDAAGQRKLVASSGKLSSCINESSSQEDWHRKARGLPTQGEEWALREELARLQQQQRQELDRHGKVERDRRAQLEKQLNDLVKQSYVGGFVPRDLQTPNISLKKGENVLWETGATKMKQRISDGTPHWETDESGTLIVTNQRIIFRSASANLWTRNLSKVVSEDQQYGGRLPIVAIWMDGVQKPVGFQVGEVQATFTRDSRSFHFALSGKDLVQIIRGNH